jgi:hypothetical protein
MHHVVLRKLFFECTVNGERNSGTTFLSLLLQRHGLLTYDGLNVYKLQLTSKHDFPGPELKLVGDRVVNFFIIRDLDEWLISMFSTPYYLTRCAYQPFLGFLFDPVQLSRNDNIPIDIKTLKISNYSDEFKTVFDIRYEKIKSYLKYFQENDNVVIVRLKYLQNEENCIHFMKQVSEKYGFNISIFYGGIDTHVKTNEPNVKNHSYPTKITSIERAIINLKKNEEIEKYVNNLTFEMK